MKDYCIYLAVVLVDVFGGTALLFYIWNAVFLVVLPALQPINYWQTLALRVGVDLLVTRTGTLAYFENERLHRFQDAALEYMESRRMAPRAYAV